MSLELPLTSMPGDEPLFRAIRQEVLRVDGSTGNNQVGL